MGADYVIAVNLSHDLTLGNRLRKNSGVLKNMVENPSQNNTPKHKYKILDALNSRFASMDFSALKQIKSWANTGDTPGIFEILISSINIAEVKITSANFKAYPPDLLIQPALGHVRFLDYDKGRETMEEGYRETKLRLKEL
jgi:NTE family protein